MKGANAEKSIDQHYGRVIFIVVVTLCFAGCWLIPLHDTGDRAVDLTEMPSLIGSNKTSVIEKFGPPQHRIAQGDKEFFVYEGHLDTTAIIFAFWIPVGIGPIDEKGLDCIKLNFEGGVLEGYDVETRSMVYHDRLKDCRSLFWSAEDIAQIDPLVGASMAKVKNTFGEPHWVVQDKANKYLVYQYSHPLRNACVLLDFGDRYLLRQYEIKSCGLVGEDCPSHREGEIEWGRLDCRQLFWTLDELNQMGIEDPEGYTSLAGLTDEEMLDRAEAGNAAAQLQLYWATKGPKRLTWLCRAAENGYPPAQAELGRLYKSGLQGLERDPAKAYQWYWRANKQRPDKWRRELNEALRGIFSTEMQPPSKGDLTEPWPIQCERDFPPTDADD